MATMSYWIIFTLCVLVSISSVLDKDTLRKAEEASDSLSHDWNSVNDADLTKGEMPVGKETETSSTKSSKGDGKKTGRHGKEISSKGKGAVGKSEDIPIGKGEAQKKKNKTKVLKTPKEENKTPKEKELRQAQGTTGTVTLKFSSESYEYSSQVFGSKMYSFITASTNNYLKSITVNGDPYLDSFTNYITPKDYRGTAEVKVELDINAFAYKFSGNNYGMFQDSYAEEISFNISTSQAQGDTFRSAFQNAKYLQKVDFGPGIDTSKSATFAGMFYGCSKLTTIVWEEANIGQTVTDFSMLFQKCSSLTSFDLSKFKSASPTTFASMFSDCSSLTEADLTPFNFKEVTSTYFMFFECTSLKKVLLQKNINADKLTDASSMFNGCSALEDLDLSTFSAKNLVTAKSMFKGCTKLININMRKMTVTPANDDAYEDIFNGAENLCFADISGLKKTTEISKMPVLPTFFCANGMLKLGNDADIKNYYGGPCQTALSNTKSPPLTVKDRQCYTCKEASTKIEDGKCVQECSSVNVFFPGSNECLRKCPVKYSNRQGTCRKQIGTNNCGRHNTKEDCERFFFTCAYVNNICKQKYRYKIRNLCKYYLVNAMDFDPKKHKKKCGQNPSQNNKKSLRRLRRKLRRKIRKKMNRGKRA